jgi:hypothetical protein
MNLKDYEGSVCGLAVKVRFVDKLVDASGNELHGQCLHNERVIEVSKANHKTLAEVEATIFHEALHLILWTTGVTALLKTNTEEAVVRAIENGVQSFQDMFKTYKFGSKK